MSPEKRVTIPIHGNLSVEVCNNGSVYLSRPASEEAGLSFTAEEWSNIIMVCTAALAGFKAGAAR